MFYFLKRAHRAAKNHMEPFGKSFTLPLRQFRRSAQGDVSLKLAGLEGEMVTKLCGK